MKTLFLISLSLLAFTQPLFSQNLPLAKQQVDTLCSPAMLGRGYNSEGDKKAAEYIRNEFKSIGLEDIAEDYYQKFQLNVNTFPNQVYLKLGKKTLIPGRDFIPDPSSGNAWGKGKLIQLDTLIFSDSVAQEKFLQQDLIGNVLVYDEKFDAAVYKLPRKPMVKLMQAAAVIVLVDKLTFGVGRQQMRFGKFKVLKSSFDAKAKKVHYQLVAELKERYITQNVMGMVEGTAKPDSFLIVSAHYDHLGTLGENVYFPGGNDNASGTALLLQMAKHFKETPPAFSIIFIAFGAEEAGLVGSQYYVHYPIVPLDKTAFMLNLDLIGTGEEGVMVVNGLIFQDEFKLLEEVNKKGGYLSEIKKRGKAANSDHYPFSENGVKSFFFYLMGDWKNYHDIYDDNQVPLTKFPETFKLCVDFLDALQERS
ncbi:M28 family peptidase [Flammeovirgaceae bacterium SG7u.111]|nr:M28 family peptidase [Flammeovirgaceae bacterium SG7u.132]WPO33766.1 M28 family peptidase [Flammeovirgaceae bacterium SG7u.111]